MNVCLELFALCVLTDMGIGQPIPACVGKYRSRIMVNRGKSPDVPQSEGGLTLHRDSFGASLFHWCAPRRWGWKWTLQTVGDNVHRDIVPKLLFFLEAQGAFSWRGKGWVKQLARYVRKRPINVLQNEILKVISAVADHWKLCCFPLKNVRFPSTFRATKLTELSSSWDFC